MRKLVDLPRHETLEVADLQLLFKNMKLNWSGFDREKVDKTYI